MTTRPLGLALLTFLALVPTSAPITARAASLAPVVGALQWTQTGTSGVITGDYQSTEEATDSELGISPVGSLRFGFLSTLGGITPDPENGVASVSPLILNPDPRSGFTHTNGSKTTSTPFVAQAGDQLILYFNYVSTDGLDYRDYAWARLVDSATNATAAWLFLAQSGNAPDGDGTSDYVHDKVLKLQTDEILADQDQDAVLNDGQPVIGMPMGALSVWAPLGESADACWAKDPTTSSCGATAWVKSDYTLPDGGTYFLELGIMNWGDEQYQSALAFDFEGLASENLGPGITVYDNTDVPEPHAAGALVSGIGALVVLARRRRMQPVR
ncbi:MAG: NF038132 family protein [Deltaproteobacteria bacterium]|nr:NF038132 family protein [Deltaproteobacteria bacterium]